MFFDLNYMLIVMIPTLILSTLAQWYMRSTYSTWGNRPNSQGLSGPEVARRIMQQAGLNVSLEVVPGELSDHYDPTSHTVRMSSAVSQRNSVGAMAIVAHELGHAQQHQENSPLIAARGFLLPAVQISPMISYGLILAGLFLNLIGLAWLGVAVFAISVVFMVLTLPVEIDASMRGLRLLRETGLTNDSTDQNGAQAVLTAAALTYVAAAVTSVLQLLYYVNLVNRD